MSHGGGCYDHHNFDSSSTKQERRSAGERLATPAERRSYWNEPVSIWWFVGLPSLLVMGAIGWRVVTAGAFEPGVWLFLFGISAMLALAAHEAARIMVGLPAVPFTSYESSGRSGVDDLRHRYPRSHPATIGNLVFSTLFSLVLIIGLLNVLATFLAGNGIGSLVNIW